MKSITLSSSDLPPITPPPSANTENLKFNQENCSQHLGLPIQPVKDLHLYSVSKKKTNHKNTELEPTYEIIKC